MSNNSPEESRQVIIGLFKFVATGITVTAAMIGIAAAIGKARSLEPTYVYTIPVNLMSPEQELELEQEYINQHEGTQYAY